MRPVTRQLTWLVVLLAVGGCATTPQSVGERWTRTELCFGRSRPDGNAVSDADWQHFLDTAVTPRFPDGLTVLQAQGRYRMSDQSLIVEPTGVLVILHHGGDADARIDAICQDYIRRFRQESVLRTDMPARAALVRSAGGPVAMGTP